MQELAKLLIYILCLLVGHIYIEIKKVIKKNKLQIIK